MKLDQSQTKVNTKIVRLVLFTLLSIFLLSCKVSDKDKTVASDYEKLDTNNDAATDLSSERLFHKKFQAGRYSINFEAEKIEITTLKVLTNGLEHEYDESFVIEGIIENAYMTDLNQDGYKEYIISYKPLDDSGNVAMIGLASNRDKSMSKIYFDEPNALRDVNTDRLIIKESEVIRRFESNGETMAFKYELLSGESGYIMKATKISD